MSVGWRLEYRPPRRWRWWLHLGANETALMYPRRPMPDEFARFVESINQAMIHVGVPLAKAAEAMLSATRAMTVARARHLDETGHRS